MMSSQETQIELETQLQALLCGSLSAAERRRLLQRIAEDEPTRRLMKEMLAVQEAARAAFGYGDRDEQIEASLRQSLANMADHAGRRQPSASRPSRRYRPVRWLAGVAAAAIIGVTLYSAFVTSQGNQFLREQLLAARRSAGEVSPAHMPALTAGEAANYRRLWRNIDDPTSAAPPWVLLHDGAGEFGYLPGDSRADADRQLILLRCLVVAADGRSRYKVDLLLPARRTVRLDLPKVGRLAGRAVRCRVVAGRQWATVGLQIGERSDGVVGLSGRARVGRGSAEIGHFHLDGKEFHVVLEATSLNGSVG